MSTQSFIEVGIGENLATKLDRLERLLLMIGTICRSAFLSNIEFLCSALVKNVFKDFQTCGNDQRHKRGADEWSEVRFSPIFVAFLHQHVF